MLNILEKDPNSKSKMSQTIMNTKQKCYEKTNKTRMSNNIEKLQKNRKIQLLYPALPSSILATLAAFAPTEALDCSSPASVKKKGRRI